MRSRDKGDLLGASSSSRGTAEAWGRFWTPEGPPRPPGSLSLLVLWLSIQALPFLFIYSANHFQVPPACQALLWLWESGNDQTKIFALIGAPILAWGPGTRHADQQRK